MDSGTNHSIFLYIFVLARSFRNSCHVNFSYNIILFPLSKRYEKDKKLFVNAVRNTQTDSLLIEAIEKQK